MSDESAFQRECDQLWSRSVFCHVGSFVEPLLGYDEDLRQEHDEALMDALRAEAEEACPEDKYLDEDGDEDEDARAEAIDEYVENNDREPMEYYSVDPWMAARLAEQSEAVFEVGSLRVWIRCSTGQAVSLDDCIRQITRNLLAERAKVA